MPYDPQWPQNGQNIDADRFRGQFSSLIDLINQASGITAVVVDSVVTVPAADPASVNLSLIGSTLHFSFAIPRGQEGVAGLDGQPGPPFAQAVVDGVTTLNPGDPATVSVSFDGVNVHFNFGIPSGFNGADGGEGPQGPAGDPGGPQGPPGADGIDGAEGPPGEVSNADLTNAINGTSANTNAVATLGMGADGGYNQSQMQDLINKVDELITAMRR
jgi:hypothetical protein